MNEYGPVRTAGELTEILKTIQPSTPIWAYEGEVTGIVLGADAHPDFIPTPLAYEPDGEGLLTAQSASIISKEKSEDLAYILGRCKCSVSIVVNDHRDHCEPVSEYLYLQIERKEIEPARLARMIEMDTIVKIQAPDTPIGFYTVYHYDLDQALAEMVDALKAGQ